PQHLAGRERVAHAAHGVNHPVVGGEVDAQVLDFEEFRHQARTRVWRGSKASRRPSPMKLMLRAITMMNRPGNQNSHGRDWNAVWSSDTPSPSGESRRLTPRPR